MSNKNNLAASSEADRPLIKIQQVNKFYAAPEQQIQVLKNIHLDIFAGEWLAIVGKSGSGKTTLINCLTGIDQSTSGEITIKDQTITQLDESELAQWRGKNIGLVFQFFQLLPTLSILENIILPMDFCNQFARADRAQRAMQLLTRVGIAEHAHKLPSTLSGGQQQRAAIARALANDPLLIVADEPTGNLDSNNSLAILKLFSELAREGKTIITVSHERDIALHASRVITLADGAIIDDISTKNTSNSFQPPVLQREAFTQ